jgi:hypothetical protein
MDWWFSMEFKVMLLLMEAVVDFTSQPLVRGEREQKGWLACSGIFR